MPSQTQVGSVQEQHDDRDLAVWVSTDQTFSEMIWKHEYDVHLALSGTVLKADMQSQDSL